MSGHVGDLSPQQEEALRKFKAAVADIQNKPEDDDCFHLRWLRARRFDVRKAELMLRNHMKYREQYGADTILHDYTPPVVLQKHFPGGFFGEDRAGHPVWYDNFGNLDFKGLHRSTKREEVFKLKCLHMEQIAMKTKEHSEKHGRYIETITVVIDFENLCLKRHYYWPGIETLKEVLTQVEDNVPERMRYVFIVKAPSIFPVGYNLIKHVLDEKTREKIKILSGSNWQTELQKYISPDQLPQAFGGNRCEPDPWCSNYINPGYDVPREYYLTNLTETSREEMERVVVGRRAAHKVTFEVKEPRSVLQWEFVTNEYDIAFGVYLKSQTQAGKKKKEELVAVTRRESHVIPETGFHICEIEGTYVLKFDNSYSWTRSKEVFYSIKVAPPDRGQTASSLSGDAPVQLNKDLFECDEETAQTGLSLDAGVGITGQPSLATHEEVSVTVTKDEKTKEIKETIIYSESVLTTV